MRRKASENPWNVSPAKLIAVLRKQGRHLGGGAFLIHGSKVGRPAVRLLSSLLRFRLHGAPQNSIRVAN